MIVDAGVEEEGLLQSEGICNENAPQFQRTKTVEIMMAIDPDTAPDEAESSKDERKEPEEIGGVPDWYLDAFDPFEPGVAEAASASARPTPVEIAELIARGRALPAWRRDDFPAVGPVRRSVLDASLQLAPCEQRTRRVVLFKPENKQLLEMTRPPKF